MAGMPEVQLYLARARDALQQAQDNLGLDHYDVATSRAYYGFYHLRNRFLRLAVRYLEAYLRRLPNAPDGEVVRRNLESALDELVQLN